MRPPLVTCPGCDRGWHSATMADGLRLLGGCPRCGSGLVFHDDAATSAAQARAADARHDALAPHLVLGAPRR